MLYSNFIIFKEHKFLRNIFSSDILKKTNSLKDLKTFHEKFISFLKIAVFLKILLTNAKIWMTVFNGN